MVKKQNINPQHKLTSFEKAVIMERKNLKTKSRKTTFNRVRLENSKENLKKNRITEEELAKLKSQDKTGILKNRIKKLYREKTINPVCVESFDVVPYHHRYFLGQIVIFITLVLSAATSFRCASRVIEIMMTFLNLPLPSPSWYSGRLWLLRVGYYKLTRPKEQADDWVWIVDHTIQLVQKRFCDPWYSTQLITTSMAIALHKDVEPII
jgi:hypothetical protein